MYTRDESVLIRLDFAAKVTTSRAKKIYEIRGRFENLRATTPQEACCARLVIREEIFETFFALTTRAKPQVILYVR